MALIKSHAPTDFSYFTNHVFSQSFDHFVGGRYIEEVCRHMARHRFTFDITGRDHFKSTRLYDRVMFNILRSGETGREGHYFSYQSDMAEYHLANVKRMIERNPFFDEFEDQKPTSESVLAYRFQGKGPLITYTPHGLLSFKRGIHADDIFVDDPLQDPANKLDPTQVRKINRVIKAELLAMVNAGGEGRVVGTPQTWADFYFDPDLQKRFEVWIRRAMLDEKNRVALWPEWKSFEELEEIRETIGQKLFDQEYNATPAYEADSYVDRKKLLACVTDNINLRPDRVYREFRDAVIVGGWDLGKRAHPSHVTLWKRRVWTDKAGNEYVKWKQLHSRWFSRIDYSRQLEYVKLLDDCFGIDVMRYDNTRGELEGFAEQGQLPSFLKPVTFSQKTKHSMAANFNTIIEQKRAELLNESRQFEQILAVNNDLQAMETPEGHGDSFWSNAMALLDEAGPKVPKISGISL